MQHLQSGTLLQGGKYKIVRFINAGGFGCTYEAIHTGFDERVAIKEFFVRDFCNRDEQTSHVTVGTTSKVALVKKLQKKFVEEARAIRKLRHDNIVQVSDVFEENGTAYYVMDYIEGQSLNDIIKRTGAMSESKAKKYIKQVAKALKYVHSQNRLHLDIKPGNILVNKGDDAILIDFGTSKQYDEVDGENTSTLLGKTPGYAPIEQMGNDVIKFTPATDIYALGATFYKLLTGITPPNATLLASGEELKPLPKAIAENTCDAVYKAMETNKNKRLQSIEEFLEILGGQDGEDDTVPVEEVEIVKAATVSETNEDNKDKGKRYLVALIMFFVLAGIVISNLITPPSLPIEEVQKDFVTGQTFTDATGKDFTYTGEVEDTIPNGNGTGIYTYGNYTGGYRNGYRHGQGVFETKDGTNKYEGTFVNDKYDEGTLTMSDGYFFKGKFKDGKPYTGNWYDKDGSFYYSIVNGKEN